jgi:O-antigen/teichoic acid export membrane protein
MSIKKNFLYNLLYQILVLILPLVTTPYISRVLSAAKIGIYSYTYSIANYFVLFAAMGLSNYGNRYISKIRGDKKKLSKAFCSIYGMQLATSFITIVAYTVYLYYFVKNDKIIASIQVVYVISSLMDISWFFFGIEQFKLIISRNIIIKILTVCCIFIFVKQSDDLWIYTLIMAMGIFFSQCIPWRFLKNYIFFSKPTFKEIIVHFKPNLVLFVSVLAVSIYTIMDKVLLGALSNMSQVGFYDSSEKIMNIPYGIIGALATVMLPRMSNLYAKGELKKGEQYFSISMKFAMFVAFALMFGLAGIAGEFAPIFFGKEFKVCGILIMALTPSIVFYSWANVIRTQYLIPKNLDKIYVISSILGAVINVIVDLFLIHVLGAMGTIIGTDVAEGIVAIYQTVAIKKEMKFVQYIKNSFIFLIAGFIMFLALRLVALFMGQKIITILVCIVVGVIIYCGICIVYFLHTKDEILKELFGIIQKSKYNQ